MKYWRRWYYTMSVLSHNFPWGMAEESWKLGCFNLCLCYMNLEWDEYDTEIHTHIQVPVSMNLSLSWFLAEFHMLIFYMFCRFIFIEFLVVFHKALDTFWDTVPSIFKSGFFPHFCGSSCSCVIHESLTFCLFFCIRERSL